MIKDLDRLRNLRGETVMEELLWRARAGEIDTLVVAGPPGYGKTEITTQFARAAASRGIAVETIRIDQRLPRMLDGKEVRPGFPTLHPEQTRAWSIASRDVVRELKEEHIVPWSKRISPRLRLVEDPNTYITRDIDGLPQRLGLGTEVVEEVVARSPKAHLLTVVAEKRIIDSALLQDRPCGAPAITVADVNCQRRSDVSNWLRHGTSEEIAQRIREVRRVTVAPEIRLAVAREQLPLYELTRLPAEGLRMQEDVLRQGVPSRRSSVVINRYV